MTPTPPPDDDPRCGPRTTLTALVVLLLVGGALAYVALSANAQSTTADCAPPALTATTGSSELATGQPTTHVARCSPGSPTERPRERSAGPDPTTAAVVVNWTGRR